MSNQNSTQKKLNSNDFEPFELTSFNVCIQVFVNVVDAAITWASGYYLCLGGVQLLLFSFTSHLREQFITKLLDSFMASIMSYQSQAHTTHFLSSSMLFSSTNYISLKTVIKWRLLSQSIYCSQSRVRLQPVINLYLYRSQIKNNPPCSRS